ncbi:MAG: MGMT family protein [Candidatus Woesearchaeota archaeon]
MKNKLAQKSFKEKVWELCKQIPCGRVSTYKEIAKKLEIKGYRAVGNALNKNPYSPEVPCHRVVCSNGKVGGFSKGIEKKINLLKKEGIKIENNRIADFEKILYNFGK